MSGAYVSCYIHYAFSTKGRLPFLTAGIRERLWPYMCGIAREKGMKIVAIGGTDDHAHGLISLPATLSIAKSIQLIKGPSSKWLREHFPDLRNFSWQAGYGAFSVGYNSVQNVVEYIRQQEQHHARHTYQEEFVAFLRKYHIEYDERYLWDDKACFLGSE